MNGNLGIVSVWRALTGHLAVTGANHGIDTLKILEAGLAGVVDATVTVDSVQIDQGGISGQLHTGDLLAGTIASEVSGLIDVRGMLHQLTINHKLTGHLSVANALEGSFFAKNTGPQSSITLGEVAEDASVNIGYWDPETHAQGQITVLGDWRGMLGNSSLVWYVGIHVIGNLQNAQFGFAGAPIMRPIRFDGDCINSEIRIGATLVDADHRG